MQLELLANHTKDQVILMHFEKKKIFKGKCMYNILVETEDENPYSNHTDVI